MGLGRPAWNTSAPAATFTSFNTPTFGLTRLDANLLSATSFRIGIADARGDGRPDYRYHARVLYGNTVSPSQASAGINTPLVVAGLGFRPGIAASVGGLNASQLAVSATQLIVTTPPFQDGTKSLTVTDPATGSSSVMTDVLTFGAGPTDIIKLIQGANPPTRVGGETANRILVQATSADGSSSRNGATVVWNVPAGARLSACAAVQLVRYSPMLPARPRGKLL